MEARLLGSATTPGRALYEQELKRSNRQHSTIVDDGRSETALLSSIRSIFPSYDSSPNCPLEFQSRVYGLPPPHNVKRAYSGTPGSQVDEELAWFGSKLVWSRGSTVYRTFSYLQEKQTITHALFATFTLEVADVSKPQGSGQTELDENQPASRGLQTFGPFHTSQHAKWGQAESPKPSGRNFSTVETHKRCLVVVLEDWMHIYYPSGHDMVVSVPFPVEKIWSIPSGGLILQRAMSAREQERLSSAKSRPYGPVNLEKGSNLDATMELVLEELEMGRMEDNLGESGADGGRVYSLLHPSSEMRPISRGSSLHVARSESRPDYLPNDPQLHAGPLSCDIEILWISDLQGLPVALSYDHINAELVFWTWSMLPPDCGLWSHNQPDKHDNIESVATGDRPGKAHTTAAKRPSIARLDSNVSAAKDTRSSIGGLRGPSRALNRRVSFKPDVYPPAMEDARGEGLVGLEDDAGLSARIKAEGDLLRGLPHVRRVSHGIQEADRKARLLMEDNDIGENTMMFGIDRVSHPIQADVMMQEIYRSKVTGSMYVSSICELHSFSLP